MHGMLVFVADMLSIPLERATVFVMSSAWKGLPGVFIQVMACVTPVASTDCASVPYKILKNEKWG